MATSYRILENVIDAQVSEARNAPANAALITLAGAVDITLGETVVFAHDQGGRRSYYPLEAIKADHESGTTKITARSLLWQLFNVLLPDMPDQAGEASVIIKAVIAAANALNFCDIYVNDSNIVASSRSYTAVNISHRKVGELFQDLCKDTSFVMWVGYDEVNDKFNAFYFQPVSSIEQDVGVLREGVNIVSENLQKGSLDDVCNYVLMYYFPRRYPYGEDWTEPAAIEAGTAAWTRAADFVQQAHVPGATREVRLFQRGPCTTITSDCLNEDHIHVGSTAGFAAAGGILIAGFGLLSYVSKTDTQFNLVAAISGLWEAGLPVVQGWLSDLGPAVQCEVASVYMAPITETVDQIDLYIESIVGTPGPIKVYAVSSEYGYPTTYLGTITPTAPGWQTLELTWLAPGPYYYSLRLIFQIEEAHTIDDYYTLGTGPAAAGDFFNWTIMSDAFGNVSDPLQQLSVALWSGLMTAPNTTWICTGATKALDQAAFLSVSGNVMNDNRAGTGCIRFIGAGTAKVEDSSDIAEYDRLHFYYKGNISQVEIICEGGSYYQALGSQSDWNEETLTIAAMLKSGAPSSTLISIKFTITGGSGWADGLYFLAPSSGLPVTVQDTDSIIAYGQHPEVIYAKGVTESSYAFSLAQAIVADRKIPKYAGTVVVKDTPARWSPQKSVRVMIASKDIDEVMDIYQVTHRFDGYVDLEVNSFEFDYARILAGLQSSMENLQISVGSTVPVDENVAKQVQIVPVHGSRHAAGGLDEISVGGLSGVLADNQPTTWALVALKPSSSAADIDSAVSLKHAAAHTHAESEVTSLVDDLGAKVAKSLFDAETILIAKSDNTPEALTVAASTIVGRKATGDIVALSKADALALLNVADGANAYVHPNHSGDVTSTGDGATVIAANAVTLAKLATQAAETILGNATPDAAVPAALSVAEQTLIGRITGGIIAALSIAQIRTLLSITAAGAALIDDATAADQRATLGGIIVGPASATDNAIVRFDATTGKLVQNSLVTVDDNGNISIPQMISIGSVYMCISEQYSDGAAIFGYNSKSNPSTVPGMVIKKTNAVIGADAIRMSFQEGITFHSFLGSVTAGDVFSSERMRIDTAGNVGIGTINGLSKLSVNGGVHIGGDSDAGDNNLLVDGTAGITGILTAATPTFTGLTTVNQTNGSIGLAIFAQKNVKWWGELVAFKRRGSVADVDGAVESGGELGGLCWQGWDSAAYASNAKILVQTTEAFTTIAHGTKLIFAVTPNGSVTLVYPLAIDQDSSAKFTGFIKTGGGIHVGGDSDPGADNLLVDGTATITGGFGCNAKTAQTAYASGGAITPGAGAYGASSAANFAAMVTLVQNIRAALVANGIMS